MKKQYTAYRQELLKTEETFDFSIQFKEGVQEFKLPLNINMDTFLTMVDLSEEENAIVQLRMIKELFTKLVGKENVDKIYDAGVEVAIEIFMDYMTQATDTFRREQEQQN